MQNVFSYWAIKSWKYVPSKKCLSETQWDFLRRYCASHRPQILKHLVQNALLVILKLGHLQNYYLKTDPMHFCVTDAQSQALEIVTQLDAKKINSIQ